MSQPATQPTACAFHAKGQPLCSARPVELVKMVDVISGEETRYPACARHAYIGASRVRIIVETSRAV